MAGGWSMLVLSLALTALCLFGLARFDPKRERDYRARRPIRALRIVLVVLCLLPGVWVALLGNAAVFVLWAGGTCVFGWLVTQGVNRLARMSDAHSRTILGC